MFIAYGNLVLGTPVLGIQIFQLLFLCVESGNNGIMRLHRRRTEQREKRQELRPKPHLYILAISIADPSYRSYPAALSRCSLHCEEGEDIGHGFCVIGFRILPEVWVPDFA